MLVLLEKTVVPGKVERHLSWLSPSRRAPAEYTLTFTSKPTFFLPASWWSAWLHSLFVRTKKACQFVCDTFEDVLWMPL
jgi:hypothetical protein